MILRPQDVLVCLELALAPANAPPSYADLGRALGLSASQAHDAVRRAIRAGLLAADARSVRADALLEFVVHGVKYAFPPQRGPVTRGVPTAHSAPPLRSQLQSSGEELVWPDPQGEARGESLEPLYKTAPRAARGNPALYELLALTDALRVGRARERALAEEMLRERLIPAKL